MFDDTTHVFLTLRYRFASCVPADIFKGLFPAATADQSSPMFLAVNSFECRPGASRPSLRTFCSLKSQNDAASRTPVGAVGPGCCCVGLRRIKLSDEVRCRRRQQRKASNQFVLPRSSNFQRTRTNVYRIAVKLLFEAGHSKKQIPGTTFIDVFYHVTLT